MARDFNAGRSVSAHAQKVWRLALEPYLAARTRLRADTTLALLTDEEFWRRQAALEDAAAREIEARPVIDTLDLLVLRKKS
jgi:hypothetical protein